jgi:hypothetical protein
MKKVFLVLILMSAAVAGIFIFLSSAYTKSQITDRIEDLIAHRADASASAAIKRKHLTTFFDYKAYDPEAPEPAAWVEKWTEENREPGFRRNLQSLKIIEGSREKTIAEFTTQEGFAADPEAGLAEEIDIHSYRIIFTYDDKKQDWFIQSLRSLSENDP